MIIYKITNIKNNKIYIGLTTLKSAQCRFNKHLSEAKCTNENRYFLNALRKYGRDNFKVEQIDFAYTLEELKQKEIHYINILNSTNRKIGYNRSLGGDGTPGVKKSKETKDKIRQKALGRKKPEEVKKYLSELYKGRKAHINTLKNLNNHNLKTSKKVAKLDLNKNIIIIYNNITEASRIEKVDRSRLSGYLKSSKFESNISYKGFLYQIVN